MPRISKIPNKKHVNLVANQELIEKAKEKGINLSLLFDAALERELNPECEKAFMQAVTRKLDSLTAWMEKNPSIEGKYYKDMETKSEKGGEKNVLVQKEGHGNLKQALTSFGDS